MKYFYFVLFLIFAFFGNATTIFAQSKKKADEQTKEWRYEMDAVGTGTQGTYQIKSWSYSKKPETATEQAKKNAVHGIIFKGFPDKDGVKGQKALAQSPTLEKEKEDFFNKFFTDGGQYMKYVTLANNGAIGPGDRIKIGKEYKIGVVVSVNVADLRKYLEDENIIRGLSSGF